MMKGPKKDIKAAVLMALPPPGKMKKPAKAEESDDMGVGLESAVGDFFRLGKAGDMSGAAAALKDAIEICKGYQE